MGLEKTELVRLKTFLELFFEKIVVCAYIRPVKAYMESDLQERVKNGYAQFDLAKLYPDYKKRFEKFEEVFGDGNVRYWKYDPSGFTDGDVVNDFCERLGIQKDFETVRSNEGLSKAAMVFLYRYWRYGPGYGRGYENIVASQRLVRFLQCLGGAKFRLCPHAVERILKVNAQDIFWMEQRLGDSLTPQPLPESDCIGSEPELLAVTVAETVALLDLIKVKLGEDDVTAAAAPASAPLWEKIFKLG